jgi:predicted Holliday junction resolvase-like endonuclease
LPWLEGLLGLLILVQVVWIFRMRQGKQLDQSLLVAREQTIERLLEENKYHKELFELGDASYKEAQERIQALLGALNAKDIALTRGTSALEEANNNLKNLLSINEGRNQDIHKLEQLLEFQEGQYKKLLGQKKSSEVRTGKITEQISPFLADYPLEPKTARFIGDPIDFVHFDDEKVTFVEVKSGKSQLSKKQRQIRDMIKDGKVDFVIYRVRGEDDDGTN